MARKWSIMISAEATRLPLIWTTYSPGLSCRLSRRCSEGTIDAHVQGELASYGADAGQEVAVLFFVHKRYEAVAHFQFHDVQGQQGLNLLGAVGSRAFLFLGFRELVFGLDAFGKHGHAEQGAGDDQKSQGRHSGYHGEEQQHTGHELQGFGVVGQLADEFFAHLGLGRGPTDDDAGGCGGDQGRDGRDQTVADGQQGKCLGRFHPAHVFLQDADEDAADDVDDGDEDARVDVTGHELAQRPSMAP